MNPRLIISELAASHGLTPTQINRLEALAGFHQEPQQLLRRIAFGALVIAASLFGLSIILWLAANWDLFGRFGRFALLEGIVILAGTVGFLKMQWRLPLGMLTLLTTGGLFAYFGQTYQTGADPWQLFALWSIVTLPLCFGLRHDVIWTPWLIISVTAVTLWVKATAGVRWGAWAVDPTDVGTHFLGWLMLLGLCALLSPSAKRITNASIWAWRSSLTACLVILVWTGLSALFEDVTVLYMSALALVFAIGGLLYKQGFFDVFGASVAALCVNILVTCGVGNALLHGKPDIVSAMFILGATAVSLLATSVSLIFKRDKLLSQPPEALS